MLLGSFCLAPARVAIAQRTTAQSPARRSTSKLPPSLPSTPVQPPPTTPSLADFIGDAADDDDNDDDASVPLVLHQQQSNRVYRPPSIDDPMHPLNVVSRHWMSRADRRAAAAAAHGPRPSASAAPRPQQRLVPILGGGNVSAALVEQAEAHLARRARRVPRSHGGAGAQPSSRDERLFDHRSLAFAEDPSLTPAHVSRTRNKRAQLAAALQRGNLTRSTKLLSELRQLEGGGHWLSVHTYNVLISLAAQTAAAAGGDGSGSTLAGTAPALFRQLVLSGQRPNERTFVALLDGVEARRCAARALAPSTLSALLVGPRGGAGAGAGSGAGVAAPSYEDLEASGALALHYFAEASRWALDRESDVCVAFLRALGRAGCFRDAVRFWARFVDPQSATRESASQLGKLLQSTTPFAPLGDADEAAQLAELTRIHTLTGTAVFLAPSAAVFGALIDGACVIHSPRIAYHLYELALKSALELPAATYTQLLRELACVADEPSMAARVPIVLERALHASTVSDPASGSSAADRQRALFAIRHALIVGYSGAAARLLLRAAAADRSDSANQRRAVIDAMVQQWRQLVAENAAAALTTVQLRLVLLDALLGGPLSDAELAIAEQLFDGLPLPAAAHAALTEWRQRNRASPSEEN